MRPVITIGSNDTIADVRQRSADKQEKRQRRTGLRRPARAGGLRKCAFSELRQLFTGDTLLMVSMRCRLITLECWFDPLASFSILSPLASASVWGIYSTRMLVRVCLLVCLFVCLFVCLPSFCPNWIHPFILRWIQRVLPSFLPFFHAYLVHTHSFAFNR